MQTRIAAVSIIVENLEVVDKLNNILHDYNDYIIGRLGIPYRQRGISIICIILDAPNDVISALAGKLGMLPNVTAKTVYSKPFPVQAADDGPKEAIGEVIAQAGGEAEEACEQASGKAERRLWTNWW
ncbi:MAG: iron-only hydrogenase system regulator [Firmicutes bacterium]|mgnify:CR=1 FL=1|nr:iron-only hydrogenase system regulator [Bacillota bacterium]